MENPYFNTWIFSGLPLIGFARGCLWWGCSRLPREPRWRRFGFSCWRWWWWLSSRGRGGLCFWRRSQLGWWLSRQAAPGFQGGGAPTMGHGGEVGWWWWWWTGTMVGWWPPRLLPRTVCQFPACCHRHKHYPPRHNSFRQPVQRYWQYFYKDVSEH